jgi:hypothetical protein
MMQFEGWSNAQEIFDWCGKTFFVGTGYEHHMRRPNEHDRGNGHIHDNAAPFLVLTTSEGEKVRVDIGEWIVLGGSDGEDLGKMTQAQLEKFYVDIED